MLAFANALKVTCTRACEFVVFGNLVMMVIGFFLQEVAKASNRYPVISLEFELSKTENISPGENIQCTVQLERDLAVGSRALSGISGRCPVCPQFLLLHPGLEFF